MAGTVSLYGKSLSEYTSYPYTFKTLTKAKNKCSEKINCGGITYEPKSGRYTTRRGTGFTNSSSADISWLKP